MLNNIISEFEQIKDSEQSIKMSKYMRNLFPFMGIPTPQRNAVIKKYFKNIKQIDWNFINNCWDNDYRELQYVALEYLSRAKMYLGVDDIPKLKALAVKKSWWDTIDGLDRIVGDIALRYPEVNDIIIQWSVDDNMWLRRIAIDHQLLRKDKTDTELLEKIIVNNFGSREFFINKAIGWSLRDYSKTNPEWVRAFIEKYRDRLSSLSIREGSKYI